MESPGGLRDHYDNPRNLGDLDDADAVAIVHNPVCGDMLRLAVRCEGGTITKARFKGYGCAAAIAAGSVVAEWIEGTSVADAASLTDEDITRVLGPLPPMKVHAIVLARETVSRVVEQLETEDAVT
ncbi:MAG: iron-sulfur cluster assembly scaffold protein [Acidobacteria bacterium]|nr:iron-sulfur cluster assembly scaffold protein [Acidobacteriota bacterium]